MKTLGKLQICISNRFITIQIFSIFDRTCNRCCIWSLGGVRMKRNVSVKKHNKKAAPKSTRFKKTKNNNKKLRGNITRNRRRKNRLHFVPCTEECDVDNGHCNCKWWNLNVSRNSAAVAQKEMLVTSRRTRRNDWITCKFENSSFVLMLKQNKKKEIGGHLIYITKVDDIRPLKTKASSKGHKIFQQKQKVVKRTSLFMQCSKVRAER